MSYNGERSVREYILKMVYYQTKLKALDIILLDTCIVHQPLNTLLPEFGMIVMTYNSQDEVWNVSDLIIICVAKKDKIKDEKSQKTLFVSKSPNNKKGTKSKPDAHKTI